MPAKSSAQQKAAGIALAAKRGQTKLKPGSPSAQMAKGMSQKELTKFATKPKGGYKKK
jgi:hypothetical protein